MFPFCCEWHDGRFIAASRTLGPALAKALLEAEQILARYVVLGVGKCTISKQQADMGLQALAIIQKLKEQA